MTISLNANASRNSILDEAIQIGQEAAMQAYEKTDNTRYIDVAWRFHEVNFILPPYNDFEACRKNPKVIAYTSAYSKDIYICSYAFERQEEEKTPYILGQVLVHEVIHTMGIKNECVVTEIERDIMRLSEYGIQIFSQYEC